ISVNSVQGSGGNIDFSAHPLVALSATAKNGKGGEITIVALDQPSIGNGNVYLSTTPISSGGSAANNNGDITIISSRSDNFTGLLSSGKIDTTSGKAGTGAVVIQSSLPDLTTPIQINTTDGSIFSGSVTGGSLTHSVIDLTGSTISTSNAPVTV